MSKPKPTREEIIEAAGLYATKIPVIDIAKQFDRSPVTIYSWMKFPEFIEEVENLKTIQSEERRRLVRDRMATYRELLEITATKNIRRGIKLQEIIDNKLSEIEANLQTKKKYTLDDLLKVSQASIGASRAIESCCAALSEVSGVNDVLDYLAEHDS